MTPCVKLFVIDVIMELASLRKLVKNNNNRFVVKISSSFISLLSYI